MSPCVSVGRAKLMIAHDCIGCPYATPSERKRRVSAFGGRVDVDLEMSRLTVDGIMHKLRPSWARLLAALAKRPERLVSKDHLLLALYGHREEPDDAEVALKQYVSNVNIFLRKNQVPLKISNVWSDGYSLAILPLQAVIAPSVAQEILPPRQRHSPAKPRAEQPKPIKWWLYRGEAPRHHDTISVSTA